MKRSRKITLSRSQAALPFGGGRGKRGVFSYASALETRLISSMFTLLIFAGVCYVYFVMASVAHVAQREEMSKEVTRTSAEVARLEASYLSASQKITESYARSLGFVSVSNKVFIEKTSLALTRDASQ